MFPISSEDPLAQARLVNHAADALLGEAGGAASGATGEGGGSSPLHAHLQNTRRISWRELVDHGLELCESIAGVASLIA